MHSTPIEEQPESFPSPSPPHPTTTTTIAPPIAPPPPKAKAPDRNIHNVVLGDILFKTWYPSFYPEELVGRGTDLERLYVCQWCFKYSKEIIPFLAHTKLCPSRGPPPGRLIYTRDTHAVYEVDGEEYQLLTQNLSLFAKLFLDNKSVFYDVSSFKYYLLLHHTPPSSPSSHSHPHLPEYQTVGFFSKEKQSWDNNNLACILVFPPWQRRGFGKILMGLSYELSKREEGKGGRIGGPEKPLSQLGCKGYTRFWGARVARFILFGGRGKDAGAGGLTMSVGEIARGCWMLSEDVVVALREIGVLGVGGGGGRRGVDRDGDGRRGADDGSGNGNGAVVVVSKRKVREWVRENGVDLTPPVVEEGFVEEEEVLESREDGDDDGGGSD